MQAHSESQATAQQILHKKLEITTLVRSLGKTETNAPKLKKFTKEDLDLQDDGRDNLVELIALTSLGYAAFLCKMSENQLKMFSDADFIEIMNKKFAMDHATGCRKIPQSFARMKWAIHFLFTLLLCLCYNDRYVWITLVLEYYYILL